MFFDFEGTSSARTRLYSDTFLVYAGVTESRSIIHSSRVTIANDDLTTSVIGFHNHPFSSSSFFFSFLFFYCYFWPRRREDVARATTLILGTDIPLSESSHTDPKTRTALPSSVKLEEVPRSIISLDNQFVLSNLFFLFFSPTPRASNNMFCRSVLSLVYIARPSLFVIIRRYV